MCLGGVIGQEEAKRRLVTQNDENANNGLNSTFIYSQYVNSLKVEIGQWAIEH
jgi:hypothetical protein